MAHADTSRVASQARQRAPRGAQPYGDGSGSEPDAGAGSTHQRLVETLENLRDLNIGLGMPVTFGESEHQGMHKVWGTSSMRPGTFNPLTCSSGGA